MTKTVSIFISAYFLLCSCNNPEAQKENIAQVNSLNNKAGATSLNDVLKRYEEPSQKTTISADKPSLVTGRYGTKISINPNNLVTESGNPLGKTIEVELKELTDQGQLLRANAQTVSDGRLLVSGGAYFIGMTSNGEQLKLKEGKTLRVQFPKLTDKEMALFYGQRNGPGQINWQKTTETFKSTPEQPKPAAKSIIPTRNKSRSDIDDMLDYVEGGDTTSTQEEREAVVKRQKEYKVSQKVYDEIGIEKLGWINCDKFLEIQDKADLYVRFNPKDSVESANVYLVFKDINSVIQAYCRPGESTRFENIPAGYMVKLIAYTVKGEKVFAYSSDLTIAKGQKIDLNLKEMDEKDFKKLISN